MWSSKLAFISQCWHSTQYLPLGNVEIMWFMNIHLDERSNDLMTNVATALVGSMTWVKLL